MSQGIHQDELTFEHVTATPCYGAHTHASERSLLIFSFLSFSCPSQTASLSLDAGEHGEQAISSGSEVWQYQVPLFFHVIDQRRQRCIRQKDGQGYSSRRTPTTISCRNSSVKGNMGELSLLDTQESALFNEKTASHRHMHAYYLITTYILN